MNQASVDAACELATSPDPKVRLLAQTVIAMRDLVLAARFVRDSNYQERFRLTPMDHLLFEAFNMTVDDCLCESRAHVR